MDDYFNLRKDIFNLKENSAYFDMFNTLQGGRMVMRKPEITINVQDIQVLIDKHNIDDDNIIIYNDTASRMLQVTWNYVPNNLFGKKVGTLLDFYILNMEKFKSADLDNIEIVDEGTKVRLIIPKKVT